jgi:hypothetical protein
MQLSRRIRNALVDSPASVGARARSRRLEITRQRFPDIEDMHVVDLGGTAEAWHRSQLKPAHVTVVNLFEPGTSTDRVTAVTGDACDAVRVLEEAVGRSRFDLVFSNSVLEHVGGHANRQRLAEATRAIAPYHWVQTPYRYFPVEPHWLFPGMQFLPVAARTKIALSWPLAHTPSSSEAEARASVLWTELIGIAELQDYFPESDILRERVAGLTKSIIAVKSP